MKMSYFKSKCIKDNIRNKNQRNTISALCGCQLSRTLLFWIIYRWRLHIFEVTLNIIFCFVLLTNLLNYYFIMRLLTIDRLLLFYLNIRYRRYVTSAEVIKLIICTFTMFLAIIFFSTDCSTENNLPMAQSKTLYNIFAQS